ncbi:MAG: aminotransferase class IV [Oligoflexia bacterium]|nr:aminotransferase class IV [Oligoflexia bacterium]
MQNAIINVNGRLLKPENAKVSVYDRSYLYGDSLYEVMRTYDGRFFGLEEHLARLEKSAQLCRMILSQPTDEYREQILRTAEEYRKGDPGRDVYCRIVISRGEGRIGFSLSCLTTPTRYTIYVQPVEEPSDELARRGLSLQISRRWRNAPQALPPAMKSGNYLNNLLAYLEASAEGFDDALLCDYEGNLTEGTTFNIFYIRRGILVTPPLDVGILAGITRDKLIALARGQGLTVREIRFPPSRLFEADEVFVTSSIKEVFPVTRVDGKAVGGSGHAGKPGPLTRKLREEFRSHILSAVKA